MVSWHAVALHLADRGDACALLDRTSRIVLFSTALEDLLGLPREQVEGRPWDEAIAPPAHASIAKSRLDRALSGTVRTFESEAASATGARVKLTLEAALVGRDAEQALLLTVVSAQPMELDCTPRHRDEVDYEIAANVSQFGRLLSMKLPTGPESTEFGDDARCYDVIRGRRVPCEDCPALQRGVDRWPRTSARRLENAGEAYEVMTADADGDRIRVRLRRVSEQTLGAIYESKVRGLADTAHLSDRERDVFTYLLMGRSLADIATILNISPRTVKFHQANVLEKLGADSRTDLFRLIT